MEDQIDPITDPVAIHRSITEHFSKWFEPLHGNQASNNIDELISLAQPWPQFAERFRPTKIPMELLRDIYDAMQAGPSEEKKAHMAHTLTATPSFDEFSTALKYTGNHSAPGVSGLTYSMIKAWPLEIQSFIYDQLVLMWSANKTYPGAWKVKWLAPIPKSPVPHLDNLRPISLLETLRKLWVAIIIDRIQALFKAGGYLHPARHGCLRGVGTDEAVFQNLIQNFYMKFYGKL